MADTMQKITAAPMALNYQGTRYELTPLSLADIAQVKDFLKKYIMTEAEKTVAAMTEVGAPPEHITEVWREATVAVQKPMTSNFLKEPEPLVEFVYLSLRRKHSQVTNEFVRVMLEDNKVLQQIVDLTDRLNAVEAAAKNSSRTVRTKKKK